MERFGESGEVRPRFLSPSTAGLLSGRRGRRRIFGDGVIRLLPGMRRLRRRRSHRLRRRRRRRGMWWTPAGRESWRGNRRSKRFGSGFRGDDGGMLRVRRGIVFSIN